MLSSLISLTGKSPIEEEPERTPEAGEYQYTPEEAALLMRRQIFIRLKWFAILGVIIATLVASQVFHISFPTLPKKRKTERRQ